MPLSVFRLRGGRVTYQDHPVLVDVEFEMAPGEFVALLGGNGAGKTTLVRALLGLTPLSAGSLEVFDTPIGRFRDHHRLGYVPQRLAQAAEVPACVEEVVMSGRASQVGLLRRPRSQDREAVRRALDSVGLTDRGRDDVRHLSAGQQQRVMIARALAVEPEVLVLDEPAAGIDVESQQALAATLAELRQQGRAVLLVAHGLGAMVELVDRTVVLDAGRVIHDGPPLMPPGAEHLHVHGDVGPHSHVHHHPGEER